MLAFAFLILDYRSVTFHKWRENSEIIVYPIEWVVNAPGRVFNWLSVSFSSRQRLLEENQRLRAEELLLNANLQKLMNLEHENAQLKQLLNSSTEVTGKYSVVDLLNVANNSEQQEIILNRGSHAHIYVGQPVLDAYGVMGQVIDVTPLTSTVLLISDHRSAVPVLDTRNGLRAIAIGLGAQNQLALVNIPDTSDIKVGDLFVASGLGSRYPVGYPVGKVIFIDKKPEQQFATILLAPLAHLQSTSQVLLVWPKAVDTSNKKESNHS